MTEERKSSNITKQRWFKPVLLFGSIVLFIAIVIVAFNYLDTHFMGFHRTVLFYEREGKELLEGALSALANSNPAEATAYLRSFGAVGPIISAILMIVSSVVAPIPAFALTFANGMVWGFLPGAALSWFSAMLGAALCFWLARLLGRPLVEKLAGGTKALEVSDLFFERYGSRTVLIARLLPFVSFDLISYGAGLTDISFPRFLIATGAGQLPATLVYSWLASRGGAATSLRVLLYVFSATAVLLVLASCFQKPFMRWLRGRKTEDAPSSEGA